MWKRMKMKRLLSGLTTVVVMVGIVTACAEQDSSGLSDDEVDRYSRQLTEALNNRDNAAMETILYSVFRRTTGLTPDQENPPGISETAWHIILCRNQKALGRIITEEQFEAMRDRFRFGAMIALSVSDYAENTEKVIQCGEKSSDPYSIHMKRAVDWVNGWKTASGEQLYKEALEYRDKKKEWKFYELLENYLLHEAEDKVYKPALYDRVQRAFQENDTSYGLIYLGSLADDDYLPAQLEIARRFRLGDGFEQSNAKAVYWLQRAQSLENRQEIQDRLDLLLAKLLKSEHRSIETWIKYNISPTR